MTKKQEVKTVIELTDDFIEKIFSVICDAEENAEKLFNSTKEEGLSSREFERIITMYANDRRNLEELRLFFSQYRSF